METPDLLSMVFPVIGKNHLGAHMVSVVLHTDCPNHFELSKVNELSEEMKNDLSVRDNLSVRDENLSSTVFLSNVPLQPALLSTFASVFSDLKSWLW